MEMTTTAAPKGDFPVRVCSDCGVEFEQTLGGRPRKRCYVCSPAKLNQRQYGYATRDAERQAEDFRRDHGVEPETPMPYTVPVARVRPEHCPECGSFPATDSACHPFCNPQHRQRFAEKVATAKRGHPASVAVRRQGGWPRGARRIEQAKAL